MLRLQTVGKRDMTGAVKVIPKSFCEIVSCDVCLLPLVKVRACHVILVAFYPFPVDLDGLVCKVWL
jgi:hypothetical protein